ncbi:MAG: sigma 54-interacting transcriptional regulator [Nitrospirota bacterium]|nr:sigma 54-interacting transcriptional regulator [Nitrospirota bacterium]
MDLPHGGRDNVPLEQGMNATGDGLRPVGEGGWFSPDALPVLVAYLDSGLVYRYCNARYTEWFGFDPAVRGLTVQELVGASGFSQVRHHFESALGGREVVYETTLPVGDAVRHLRVFLVPDRGGAGRVRGLFASVLDISVGHAAERSLRDTARRLALHVRHTPLAVIEWTPDFCVAEWNRAAEVIFGFSREEAIGRHAADLIVTGDGRQDMDLTFEALLTRQGGTYGELSNVTKDGRSILCEWHNTPLMDERGEVVGVASTVQDITDRRHTEHMLEQSRDLLQLVLNAIPVRVFWKDTNLVYMGCNRRFVEDAGLSGPEQIVGRDDFQMPWGEQAEQYRADDRQVMESGVPKLNYLETLIAPDGRTMWLRTSKVPLRGADGTVVGVMGCYEDITEARRTERLIQESEERFRLLAEHIEQVFWFVQAGDPVRVLYLSPAFARLFGVPVEQVYQSPQRWLELVHPEDRPRLSEAFRALVVGTASRYELDYRVIRPDGTLHWLRDRGTALPPDAGGVRRVSGIIEDITARHQMEEALKASEARYRHLIESAATAMLEQDLSGVLAELEHLRTTGVADAVDLAQLLDRQPELARNIINRMRVVNANPAAVRLFEADSREQLLESFGSCYLADSEAGCRAALLAMFRGDSRFDAEVVYRSLAGKPIRALVSFAVPGTTEDFARVTVTLTDLTELRLAEEMVRSKDRLMRSVVEGAEMVLFALAPDGTITLSEGSGLRRVGLRSGESVGRSIFDLYGDHPDTVANVRQALKGTPGHYTSRVGDAVFEVQLTPQFDDHNRLTGVVGVAVEVSRALKAEEEARQALAEVERLRERLAAENVYLQEELRTEHHFDEMVGHSAALGEILARVEQVAPTTAAVLIQGESGTGKELVARAIHQLSPRRDRALVKINCGAIPENLAESELFGHEAGAFTSAERQRLGRFEVADGGTLFLDEVGELPLDAQVKLLRVLQEGEFERVGGTRTITADVRIIAATNRDLQQMVASGRFRADLYYRLNVFPLLVPSLRQRPEDIPALVQHFLERFAERHARRVEGISTRSMERMMSYPWPGNIRELQNVIERAVIVARRPVIDIDPGLLGGAPGADGGAGRTLVEVERQHIVRILEETGWKISGERGAAAILGMNPNTLRSRMEKLGVRRGGTPSGDSRR